jgi:hypothetical protein
VKPGNRGLSLNGAELRGKEAGTRWTLLEGTGDREYRRQVAFKRAFNAPPEVMIGLSMLDVNPGTNDRVRVRVKNITATTFDVVFSTWSDTAIYSLGANSIAVES